MREPKRRLIVYDTNNLTRAVQSLTDQEAGKLFKALMIYARDQKQTDFDNPLMALLYGQAVDEMNKDYTRYRNNGRVRDEDTSREARICAV